MSCELVVETFDQALFTFYGETGLFMQFGKMGVAEVTPVTYYSGMD